ncbi:MAG: archaetidylinositol phosphate synthase [Candidatus Hadarchaeota archaeon]
MLSEIRDRIAPFIEKVAVPFAKLGLKPNHITVLALLLSGISGYLFFEGSPILGGVMILIGGFFDIIDGAIARLTGEVTEFGSVLDSTSDRISDALIYVGILGGGYGTLLGEPIWVFPITALLTSFLVSYVRARAESAGTGKLDVGIAERAERLIILSLGAFVNLIIYALALVSVLAGATVIQRLYESFKRL